MRRMYRPFEYDQTFAAMKRPSQLIDSQDLPRDAAMTKHVRGAISGSEQAAFAIVFSRKNFGLSKISE